LIRGSFKFERRHRAKTGMEALGVVNILDELANSGGCLLKGLVRFEIHLLLF